MPDSKLHKIQLKLSGKTFTSKTDETVLNAALRQGVKLPYSCKNGTCGNCKGQLISGKVSYPHHPPLGLSKAEEAAGDVLLCQAVADNDLLVAVREIEAIKDIPVRLLPARVTSKEFLSPNVAKLKLILPKTQRMQFLAGQYIEILLPGGKRRAFSIASPPHDASELELHIRHIDGGDFTSWVFNELDVKGILRIEGPLGTFFIRHDSQRPMIMMGGGTGFAPLKSMIEYLLMKKSKRPIHLYWGAQNLAELYCLELPSSWEKEFPHIRFTPVLSNPIAADNWQGRTGFVHTAVVEDYPDLSGHEVYMSGPPIMIDTARHAFPEQGLAEDRLFYDSFEFGADVPFEILAEPH